MQLAAYRAALRRSQFALRRPRALRDASTTSEAANTLKEKASEATSKASEGLSRVSSSAGSAISKASEASSNAVQRAGGTVGRVIGLVQSSTPIITHYSRVGLELARLVFRGRQMYPPSIAEIQSYSAPLLNAVKNPNTLIQKTSETANSIDPWRLLNRFRNLDRQQLVNGAIVGAEVIGFFTVGQMIGRLKIIGYHKGDNAVAHH